MDIRTTGGPATVDEMAAVDSLLGVPTSLWEGGARHAADDHIAFGGHATSPSASGRSTGWRPR